MEDGLSGHNGLNADVQDNQLVVKEGPDPATAPRLSTVDSPVPVQQFKGRKTASPVKTVNSYETVFFSPPVILFIQKKCAFMYTLHAVTGRRVPVRHGVVR